jgi:hypothetical protein
MTNLFSKDIRSGGSSFELPLDTRKSASHRIHLLKTVKTIKIAAEPIFNAETGPQFLSNFSMLCDFRHFNLMLRYWSCSERA